jgi:hypothetical protein
MDSYSTALEGLTGDRYWTLNGRSSWVTASYLRQEQLNRSCAAVGNIHSPVALVRTFEIVSPNFKNHSSCFAQLKTVALEIAIDTGFHTH